MPVNLYVPMSLIFFLFFVMGFVSCMVTYAIIKDYFKRQEEYFKKYNCMGIRRPSSSLPSPPKPKTPKR